MTRPTGGNGHTYRGDTEDNPARVTVVAAEHEPDDLGAGALPGLMCQAASVEIGIGGDGSDPFDATFLLAGPDSSGREIAVWTRLTPPTITGLIGQLEELLLAQQDALGVTDTTTTDDDGDGDGDGTDDPRGGAGVGVKRFLDPMGLRHLKTRSDTTTLVLAVGIAGLLLLAVIVQLVRS